MSEAKQKDKQSFSKVTKKVILKKTAPTEPLTLELLNDKVVGEYLRFVVGHGGGTAIDVILHHPIGVTDLDDDDWVASSADDVRLMKLRVENPAKASLLAKRTAYLREEAIDQGLLALGEDGKTLVYPDTKISRSLFLQNFKDKVMKEHSEEKDYKFQIQAELDKASDDTQVKKELAYRHWLKRTQKKAEREFPDSFFTAKGPLGETKQAAIEWMKSMTIAEVSSQLLKYGLAGRPDTSDPVGWGGGLFFPFTTVKKKEDLKGGSTGSPGEGAGGYEKISGPPRYKPHDTSITGLVSDISQLTVDNKEIQDLVGRIQEIIGVPVVIEILSVPGNVTKNG